MGKEHEIFRFITLPWTFWIKQTFTLANFVKLSYTPWKFQGQNQDLLIFNMIISWSISVLEIPLLFQLTPGIYVYIYICIYIYIYMNLYTIYIYIHIHIYQIYIIFDFNTFNYLFYYFLLLNWQLMAFKTIALWNLLWLFRGVLRGWQKGLKPRFKY